MCPTSCLSVQAHQQGLVNLSKKAFLPKREASKYQYFIVKVLIGKLYTAAPDIPPKSVAVERLNGMHMNVSWEKLTPADTRGFPTGYTVTYDTLEEGQALVEEVGQEESYKVIGNLEVTSSYVVTVAANTIGGKGVDSEEIVVDRKYTKF